MTIQSILRHHGFNCARKVLPSGRLVFETNSRASAPTARAGLAVTSHTFHGGDQPTDPTGDPAWWLMPGELDNDVDAMSTYFPDFKLVSGDEESPPVWYGQIATRLGPFWIAVAHRFDRTLPNVVPIQPASRGRRVGRRFWPAPHLYLNGNLCVAAMEDWEPQRDTVATVVAWAAHWHAFYVEWYFTGKWPAERYVAEAS